MKFRFFQSKDISYLEELVQNFITDKIVYDIRYEHFYRKWQADVFYDDIEENEEET